MVPKVFEPLKFYCIHIVSVIHDDPIIVLKNTRSRLCCKIDCCHCLLFMKNVFAALEVYSFCAKRFKSVIDKTTYRIYPAIRRDFCSSRMTSNN